MVCRAIPGLAPCYLSDLISYHCHSATATGVLRLLHFLSLFPELSSPRCPIAHSLISFKPVFSCHHLRGPLYLEFQALPIPFLLWFPPCTMLLLFSPSVMSYSCDPMDCSPPGSSVHGFSQARILEWVAISFSRTSCWLRDWTQISCIGGLYHWATRESHHVLYHLPICCVDYLLSAARMEGFPGGASGKEPMCQCRRHKIHGFYPWVGKIPWRRAWQPIPVFLPWESHGRKSLPGYGP